MLHYLARHHGRVVGKKESISAVWKDTVSEYSLLQAISKIRRVLDPNALERYIATDKVAANRVIAEVTTVDALPERVDSAAILTPHLALLDGRAALEAASVSGIAPTRALFTQLVLRHPGDARFRVGLATSCAFAYEATRASAAPDRAALDKGLTHAFDACERDERYAKALAVRGFVLEKLGRLREAQAALMEAIRLQRPASRCCNRASTGRPRSISRRSPTRRRRLTLRLPTRR